MSARYNGSKVFLSVITVCFNDCERLQGTLDNVLAQSEADVQIVVVDGASTDGTVELLQSRYSSAVEWVSEPDEGLYDAMNKGLDKACGEYCIFMNAGDSFATKEEVASLRREAFEHPTADIIYGDAIEFEGSERVLKRARSHTAYTYSMFTHHQAIFYRTGAIKEYFYDTSYKHAADWVLTARLLQNGAKAVYLQRPVCLFERGGVSQDSSRGREAAEELKRVHREVFRTPLPKRWLLISIKLEINRIRRQFPKLYDRLRSGV